MGIITEWDGDVVLEPIEHVYIHRKTKNVYTSVTKVLHSFVPEFEDFKVAERISKQKDNNPRKNPKYIGLTVHQILDLWQQMNDEANEYGNMIHEGMERYFLSSKNYKPINRYEEAAIKSYESLNINEGKVLYPERVLFSEKHNLAGTSDIIIDIDDIWFDVLDFKTNREFNFFDSFKKNLHPPLEHLQDCQYHIYTLQLSIYAYMYQLEFPHKKCRQINMLYWDKEGEYFTRVPSVYLKNEAKMVLESHRLNSIII